MKVLILGSSGYIGNRLKWYLKEQHHEVDGVDIGWFGLDAGDTLLDYNDIPVDTLLSYDTVICLAGHSSVKMCEGDIQQSWRNNVNNFVELVKKMSAKQRLIYASSGSVYGNSNIHQSGSFSFNPVNNYDITKYVLDLTAQGFMADPRSPKIIGLRFGTVCGASHNLRSELMLNAMVKSAIYNDKIQVTNGKIHRPILALGDLERAMHAMVSATDVRSAIYDLYSFNSTVNEIAMSVRKHLLKPIDIQVNPDRPGVYDFTMSNADFCNEFNFKFEVDQYTLIRELVKHYEFADPEDINGNRNTPWSYE